MNLRWTRVWLGVFAWLAAVPADAADTPRDDQQQRHQRATSTKRGASSQDDATAQARPIEVVVRGKRFRAPVSRKDPTAASTVVSRRQLQRAGATVADSLRQVPGVEVNSSGASSDVATASIRGATSAQTPVYLAGIVLNDEVTGTADLSQIPPWMLQRIDIYRGFSPRFSDRLGMAGAIHLEPLWPRRPGCKTGAGLGSFGAAEGWVRGSVGTDRSSAMLAYRAARATNDYTYLNDHGTRFDPSDDTEERRSNAWYREHSFWALSRHRIGQSTRINTLVHTHDRWQGVTGLAVIPASRATMHTRRTLVGLSTTTPCAHRGKCALHTSSSALFSLTDVRDPGAELALWARQVATSGQRLTERVGWTGSWQGWRAGISAQQAWERLHLSSSDGTFHQARRNHSTMAARFSTPLHEPVALQLVTSVERHATVGFESTSEVTWQTNARLGARWRPVRQLTFLGNAGRGSRFPTLAESYGISVAVRGNPKLEPERAWSGDLGVLWTPPPIGRTISGSFLQVFVFQSWADSLIAYRRSSFGTIRPYNVGSARLRGLEASAGLQLLEHFRLQGQMTLLDARDTTPDRLVDNDVLPFRAPLKASGSVEWIGKAILPRLHLSGGSVGLRGVYRSSRFADPAGLIVLPERTRFDLLGSVAFYADRYVIRAAVRNLFDSPQSDLVGYPEPGRSVFVSAEVSWL